MTGLAGELVAEKTALVKKNKDLDIRCQSLELTVTELQRKIEKLSKVAFESKQKAVKLQQELHETKFLAAAYNRMADRAIHEKIQLQRKYCTPVTCEGTEKKEVKEVSEGGANSSM